MEAVIRGGAGVRTGAADPARRAFQLLHWGFVAVPAIAGLDKFMHALTNWDQYLAPAIERVLPFSGHTFMLLVGVIELFAALLVAVRPRIGGYVVTAWLVGIVVNLMVARGYYDVALRDVGLAAGGLALAWLSTAYDRAPEPASRQASYAP
jgi:hypothetical protein